MRENGKERKGRGGKKDKEIKRPVNILWEENNKYFKERIQVDSNNLNK